MRPQAAHMMTMQGRRTDCPSRRWQRQCRLRLAAAAGLRLAAAAEAHPRPLQSTQTDMTWCRCREVTHRCRQAGMRQERHMQDVSGQGRELVQSRLGQLGPFSTCKIHGRSHVWTAALQAGTGLARPALTAMPVPSQAPQRDSHTWMGVRHRSVSGLHFCSCKRVMAGGQAGKRSARKGGVVAHSGGFRFAGHPATKVTVTAAPAAWRRI